MKERMISMGLGFSLLLGSSIALSESPKTVTMPEDMMPKPVHDAGNPVQQLLSSQVAENPPSDEEPMVLPTEELQKRVARYGKIIGEIPLQTPWLFAWLVERNGYQTTVYITPDGTQIFAGVLLSGDAKNPVQLLSQSSNTSRTEPNALLASTPVQPVTAEKPSVQTSDEDTDSTEEAASHDGDGPSYAMQGSFQKEVPNVIKLADSLMSVKEGKGEMGDTVYIFVDPRCPYCRKLYNATRELVKNGRATIKWIPVPILQDPIDPKRGNRLVATILQNEDPAFLERVLGRKEDLQSSPAPETLEGLDNSRKFMETLFHYDNRDRIGVPAALFVDHRDGRAKLRTGVSEPVIFNDIFGQP